MKKNLLITFSFLLSANSALAQGSPFIGKCDPSKPPGAGGCGIPEFIAFVKNVINYLFVIAIPLAVIFIVWGGFVIMTAGGSEEKVKKGKGIITASVIGLAILFGSWLIVTVITTFLKTGA